VADIILMVNISLGTAPVSLCPAGDPNDDGEITINEIIAAVNNNLDGCPTSQPLHSALDDFTPLDGTSSICPANWSTVPGRDPLQMTVAGFEATASNGQGNRGLKRGVEERRRPGDLQLGKGGRGKHGSPHQST
jgi:hypothetical protein